MGDGEVLALLAGRPNDKNYVETLQGLDIAMYDAKSRYSFNRGFYGGSSRGAHHSISTGVTLGCGKTVSAGNQATVVIGLPSREGTVASEPGHGS